MRTRSILTLILILAACLGARAQSFGTLTVVPTHPALQLQLSWSSAPAGQSNVLRWTDASPAPVVIGTTFGTTFLDTTAVVNTIYYYQVLNGAAATNTAIGVGSDISKPFNCPPMVPVSAALLGVDRTETFQSANGTQVSFTIRAPVAAAASNVINVAPCNGAGGCSDYSNIDAAFTSLRLAGTPGTVQLSAGDYHFINPSWTPGFNYNVNLFCNDCILAGAPVASGADPTTHLYFNQGATTVAQVVGITINGSRSIVRNLTVDWDFPNAIPGVVTNLDGSHQKFTVTAGLGSYYVPNPASPPPVWAMSAYSLSNFAWNLQAGARVGGVTATFNTNFGSDGLYYWTVNGAGNLPDGTEAIMWVHTSGAITAGTATTDVSLENISVWGGGGPGIIQASSAKGLRLSNVKVERKPNSALAPGERPRYASVFGDSDSNNSLGNVLIENSQFGYVDDDTYYMRGSVFQLQALSSTSTFTMTTASVIFNHTQGANDILTFYDPATYAIIGTALATWTHVGNVWTVSFPAVPGLARYIGASAGNLPVVGEVLFGAPNAIVRNTCSHDNHGRLGFLNSNVLVDNVVLANSYYGPLFSVNNNALPTGSTIGVDGPGGQNQIWRNSKIIGTNYGNTDLKTLFSGTPSNGYHQTGWGSAAISVASVSNTGFYPAGTAMSNFQIYGNLIVNTPGLAIEIGGANKVAVVGNTIVDANQIAFTAGFDATYCGAMSQGYQAGGTNQPWCFAKRAAQGSIRITNSRNIDATSTPNVFLGTSAGLFVDTSTVTTDNIVGSRFVH